MAARLAPSAHSGSFPQGSTELAGAVSVAVSGVEHGLDRATRMVRDATARLAATFTTLTDVLASQQATLAEVTATLGQLGAATFAAAAGRLVNEFVDEIVRVSHESMRIIEELSTTSEHVTAIVQRAERIDGLARETRFIALNARIETQRAGAAGSTFKVVADEVKRLAGAAAEVSGQIRHDVEQCTHNLSTAQRTAERLAGHDMTAAIASRGALIDAIERLDQINRIVEFTLKRVNESAVEATHALDFERSVSQVLADCKHRVKKLGELLLDAVTAVDQRRDDAGVRVSAIAGELRELGRSTRSGPEAVSPEEQALVPGVVELF